MQPPMKKPGLFRRTPPAIFPPIMGLFGLGLGWRRAVDAFGAPAWIGDLILGAVTCLFLFALAAYLAKGVRRPGAVGDDLKTLPGRAGLAAMTMSGMLLAITLVTLNQALAGAVLALAVAGHLILALMILRNLLTGPAEARVVTPVWHLTFVGFIVSAIAALPLGLATYGEAVFWGTGAIALMIWGVSLMQLIGKTPPGPLRPAQAIHLAPASLLGTVAYLLGFAGLGFAFAVVSLGIFAVLVLRARWLTVSGFSALWGAFTFPIAAFASLMMITGSVGQGEFFRILGGVVLVAATLMIAWITTKVMQAWAKGGLAAKTNAAEA